MTNADQKRVSSWRLRILQCGTATPRSVAKTCRHYGISRRAFYKWKRRYDELGVAGLCDRPRIPRRSPTAIAPEVVSKVLYLRERYHFGPGKVASYLQRFHGVTVAVASVHRILRRHGVNRLPGSRKLRHKAQWQRYEKPQPGHRLQLDVKFLERIPAPGSASSSSPRSMIAPGSAC